jgi:hypothetical protein
MVRPEVYRTGAVRREAEIAVGLLRLQVQNERVINGRSQGMFFASMPA